MKPRFIAILSLLILLINENILKSQTPIRNTIQVTTTVSPSTPSITFTWNAISGSAGINIYRKSMAATTWGTALASLPAAATTYTDNTLTIGIPYEYRINSTGTLTANTYLLAGIQIPQVDDRGKVILLVDSTFIVSLMPEIARLEADLVGDGWTVVRYNVSRIAPVTTIKSIITDAYNADPLNVKALFLLGHVPVPYSGNINPDGEVIHQGAWPCDGYYGDITGTWTDATVNNTSADRIANYNVPGDGKFDQNTLPGTLQLQVGRVDLSNLSTFMSSETQLMKQYLNKDHYFRHKIINPDRKGLIDDNYGYFSGESFASSGWRNFTAFFPEAAIQAGDYFTGMADQSYLWSYGCGWGWYNSSGVGTTADFANLSPKTVFTMLYGNYFGDWDSQNNLMRASLASSGWGLTCSWSGRPYSIYHHMALGENIGYSIRQTMVNTGLYVANTNAGYVHIGLMGDPTLRMHIVAPPVNVTVTGTSPKTISWTASSDAVLGYHVYRQDDGTGNFNKISGSVITGTSYNDVSPVSASDRYMVRALVLESSNSGTYYNLSQGAYDGQVDPPAMIIMPLSMSFGSIPVNIAFDKSYSIIGNNLTSDITVTSPEGFEVSKTAGSGFASSLTVTPSAGKVSQTIFVRFKPTDLQLYIGNISNVSAGVTAVNIPVTGIGVDPPVINIIPASLAFGNNVINTTSSEKTYQITGYNMVSYLSVNAPSGYEISKTSGSGFAGNLSINPSAGNINQIVYVRFKPTAIQTYNGNITHTSTYLTQQNVVLTGAGISATTSALSVTPDSLGFPNQYVGGFSVEKVYTLQGVNLTGNITVTAPSGFEVSLFSVTGFSSSITVTPVSGNVNQLIYVRFKPAAVQVYNANITNTSPGTVSENVTVTGIGTPAPSITVSLPGYNFGNVVINRTSTTRSYILTGSNLVGNITVTAPTGFLVSKSSSSGFASSINVIAVSGSVNQPIYFRFIPTLVQAYSGNITHTSTGAAAIYIAVSGNGVAVGTPMMTVNPSFLAFGDVVVNTTSAYMFYTVIGYSLTSNIIITAPSGYEISTTSGSGYAATLSLVPSGGYVNTIIYVRFKPTAILAYNASITNVSTGATSQSVDLTGAGVVNPAPILSVIPSGLDFGNVMISTTSLEKTYTLTGNNLTADVTVTAPTGYEVSKTPITGFSLSVTVAQLSGSVNQVIYVRFKPTLVQAYNGNITNASTGATAQNVALTGAGTAIPTPSLSVIPSNLDFGNVTVGTTSSEKTYTLTGSNLTADVTVTAPTDYEVSKTTAVGFSSSVTVARVSGSVNQVIYLRFKPTLVQAYNGNTTNASTGATTQNVALTGTGTAIPTPSLSVIPSGLDFGNVMISTTSLEKTFTLTGSNLTADVTVTAPTGYEVSKTTAAGFSSSVTVAQVSGSVNQVIYVRFKPTLVQPYNGNITNASAGATTQNVALTGTGSAIPTPILSVIPSSLDFGNVTVGTTSSEKTYTLTGSNLTADVTVTAPTGYEVSKTPITGYASNVTVAQVSGSVNQILYLRFKPTLVQAYNGNVTNASTGATTQNVALTGTGLAIPTPSLSVIPSSLDFGNVMISTTSLEKTYTLTGSNLTADVTVTAPTGYEVSKTTATGFSSSITVVRVSGSVNQDIYVRFKPTLVQAYNGNTTNASTGATTQDVALTGTGTAIPTPSLSVIPSNLDFGNVTVGTTSSEKTYTLTGSNLTADVTVTAPTGYEISKTLIAGYASSVTVAQVSGSVNQIIYLRFIPTLVQAYNGNITHSSAGATTQNVALTGSGLAIPTPSLSVIPSGLDFDNVMISTTSLEKTYTLTGSNLTADVTVTAPTGYEVSKTTAAGFSSSVTVAQVSGNVNQVIYVRFKPTLVQAYNGNITNASTGATTQNVALTGTGLAIPTPSLSVIPSIHDFGNVTISTTSSEKTFTLTGSNLTADVTVTAPTGYEVSKTTAAGFSSILTVAQVSGSVNQIIYVRFKPTLVQAYNDIITNASLGATTQNVELTGTGSAIPTPSLSVIPSGLDFGNVMISTTSLEKTYTLTGSNLIADVTVTAPTGYEVSMTTVVGFSSSVTVAQVSGSVTQVIYVRFKPTLGQAYNGIITNASTGATTQDVALTGTGSAIPTPSLSVIPSGLDFGNVMISTTSLEKTYTLTGSNLTADVTVTAPTGYEVSMTTTVGFSSSVTVAQVSGSLNQIIYVRFKPTLVQAYNGIITNASTGATTQDVALTGTGSAIPTPSLSVIPSGLDFGNVMISTTSLEKTFTLTGSNLTADVTVTAPTGYEVSMTTAAGFSSSVTVAHVSGSVNQVIYVRFKPTLGQAYNGNITNASAGATTLNVALTGSGSTISTPSLSVKPFSLLFGYVIINTTSVERFYTLTGSNLTDDVTVTAPTGYEVSKTSASGFSSSITVAQVSGSVNQVIYVRFNPLLIQTYTGNLTNASTGAVTQNVVLGGHGASASSTYTVRFLVEDSKSAPVNGATVIFNADTIKTDTDGQAIFSNVLLGTGKAYMVNHIGYVASSGSVNVAGNTNMNVILSKQKYNLIVNGGLGSGKYEAGTIVNISANPAVTNKIFTKWTGDISVLADPLSDTTTAVIGTSDATVTAQYEKITNDIESNSISAEVFPNPCTEYVYIKLTGADHALVNIYDLTGKKIYEQAMNTDIITISTKGYARSMYLIEIITNTDIIVKRMVIE